jgi:hypothetical protein
MSRKQRLELTWIGKDERPRLEPRILLEDTEKSFHIGIEGVSHLTPAFHRIRARQISPSHGSYCSLRLECHHRKSNLEHSGSIGV